MNNRGVSNGGIYKLETSLGNKFPNVWWAVVYAKVPFRARSSAHGLVSWDLTAHGLHKRKNIAILITHIRHTHRHIYRDRDTDTQRESKRSLWANNR